MWKNFAELILEASYEAVLYAAVNHATKYKDDPGARVVILSALGCGEYGNQFSWAAKALNRAIEKIASLKFPLKIIVVRHTEPLDASFKELEQKYS